MYVRGTAEIREITRRTFPDYTGNRFEVEVQEPHVPLTFSKTYWEGGSRTEYVLLNLITGKTFSIHSGHPFFEPEYAAFNQAQHILPENIVCVKHTIFCGKDLGITILAHPNNMNKLIGDGAINGLDLNRVELVVLSSTSHKSSYSGVRHYRKYISVKYGGITQKEYEDGKTKLQEKGILDKRGALTILGKNIKHELRSKLPSL